MKKEKAYIISHDADIDGMGPIILGKLCFDQVDYSLVNYKNIDDEIKSLMARGVLDDYDYVFITDVAPKVEALEVLNALNTVDPARPIQYKFNLIDHHQSSLANLSNHYYPWCIIRFMDEGRKACATSLFRKFLLERVPNVNLASLNAGTLASLTRLSDTWDWHDLGATSADDLAELFNSIGAERYIELMTRKLSSRDGEPIFGPEEVEIVEKRREILDEAYRKGFNSLHIENVEETLVAVAEIPYEFRNGFSQYLRDMGIDANILAIPDFARGSMSYRVLDEGSDANAFAKRFGGGGNPAAAGSPITDEVLSALKIARPEEEHSDDKK